MSIDQEAGPIAYRSRGVLKKGQVIESHKHNYGHATELLSGAIRMTRKWKTGDEVTEYRVTIGRHYPVVTVPAGIEHLFEALEDDTVYRCAFVHRAIDGAPIEKYEGHFEAYE